MDENSSTQFYDAICDYGRRFVEGPVPPVSLVILEVMLVWRFCIWAAQRFKNISWRHAESDRILTIDDNAGFSLPCPEYTQALCEGRKDTGGNDVGLHNSIGRLECFMMFDSPPPSYEDVLKGRPLSPIEGDIGHKHNFMSSPPSAINSEPDLDLSSHSCHSPIQLSEGDSADDVSRLCLAVVQTSGELHEAFKEQLVDSGKHDGKVLMGATESLLVVPPEDARSSLLDTLRNSSTEQVISGPPLVTPPQIVNLVNEEINSEALDLTVSSPRMTGADFGEQNSSPSEPPTITIPTRTPTRPASDAPRLGRSRHHSTNKENLPPLLLTGEESPTDAATARRLSLRSSRRNAIILSPRLGPRASHA